MIILRTKHLAWYLPPRKHSVNFSSKITYLLSFFVLVLGFLLNLLETIVVQFSSVAQSCPTLCDPMTVAHQVLLSMGFPRQEYWNGFPRPPPGDLPDPGLKLVSFTSPALAGRFFTTSTT